MKKFTELTDQDILNCICGDGITVAIVKDIIAESNCLVQESYIDTEMFSKLFIQHLNEVMLEHLKSNGDWACGYITADNLNELMNPDIKYED